MRFSYTSALASRAEPSNIANKMCTHLYTKRTKTRTHTLLHTHQEGRLDKVVHHNHDTGAVLRLHELIAFLLQVVTTRWTEGSSKQGRHSQTGVKVRKSTRGYRQSLAGHWSMLKQSQ